MTYKALRHAPPLDTPTQRANGDISRKRRCLRGAAVFCNEGFEDRICRHGKGRNSW